MSPRGDQELQVLYQNSEEEEPFSSYHSEIQPEDDFTSSPVFDDFNENENGKSLFKKWPFSRHDRCIGAIIFGAILLFAALWFWPSQETVKSFRQSTCKNLDGGKNEQPYNYTLALQLSILFFDAQRSGALGSSPRVSWRGDSALTDGREAGMDLVGGYYDGGDHVKFGLPMAFTCTMLSWSALENSLQLRSAGEWEHTLEAIKWATDYFIKAHSQPFELYAQVGEAQKDHNCWERPEDMTTPRTVLKIDATCPGSDLAGETAAALAAASIVFQDSDAPYSQLLLSHAEILFDFACTVTGLYSDCLPEVRPFYKSSGFLDELLWAGTWLFKATSNTSYAIFLESDQFKGLPLPSEFSWDDKTAGALILMSQLNLTLSDEKGFSEGRKNPFEDPFEQYQRAGDTFLCSFLPPPPDKTTNCGLLWLHEWTPVQYAVNIAFLMQIYGRHLAKSGSSLHCRGKDIKTEELDSFAKSQVDYLLGSNPKGMSFMVGFGSFFPQKVHHRGASLPSFRLNLTKVDCQTGWSYFESSNPNPNVIQGALVGGPSQDDSFSDERGNYKQNEVVLYLNAPMVGLLASLSEDKKSQQP